MPGTSLQLEYLDGVQVLRLSSEDGTNRLTRACVLSLEETIRGLAKDKQALVITGNDKFFSAGADLQEIAALDGATAYEFSKMGQSLMASITNFPAPVTAAIAGYCMGGGLDLALACRYRVAAPQSIFGHRGAALGLITGWGGTQRLPRIVGKARALEMFVAAEKLDAERALRMGLVDAIATDPVKEAMRRLRA
ncbi:MAG TPA: enoyl-CoA hydratase/isomerase family protein [Candidatus Sulfotelmatobacter sp.]|nr:enoyl-CoA hydratase/isomerase family protein [Candidatus Sulfotelmatobacter sp.]